MKTSAIKPNGKYQVRLTEEQSLVYRGCEVEATVIRAGFHYDVEYTTGSAIRGAPFHRTQKSEHPQGVEVVWETQEVWSNLRNRGINGKQRVQAGRAIVNARAVEFELGSENI